jgi:hypothetical protein
MRRMTKYALRVDAVEEIVCFDVTTPKIEAPRIMSHVSSLRFLYNEQLKLLRLPVDFRHYTQQ